MLRCIRTCVACGSDKSIQREEIDDILKLRGEVIIARNLFTDIHLDFNVADKAIFFAVGEEDEDVESDHETEEDEQTIYISVWQTRCRDTDSESFWDTDNVQRRAFDSDWELSQIGQLVYDIDELEPMQEILSRYFGTIRDLFRYYAAMYHTDNKLLLFPKSAWLKFCQEMRFMDEDQLTTKELSKLYGRCGGIPRDESFQRNATANEEARDRIQGLMRYEFWN